MTPVHKFSKSFGVFSACGICYIITKMVKVRNL